MWLLLRLRRVGEGRHFCQWWRETDPGIAPRAGWTDRARPEAARRVGQDGVAVAPVARAVRVAWQTVMRAVDDITVAAFDYQGIYTVQSLLCLAL